MKVAYENLPHDSHENTDRLPPSVAVQFLLTCAALDEDLSRLQADERSRPGMVTAHGDGGRVLAKTVLSNPAEFEALLARFKAAAEGSHIDNAPGVSGLVCEWVGIRFAVKPPFEIATRSQP